ncbi:MAG: RNA repair domain-containing protein [Methanomassiliicoccales archaeon]|jgi:uncharacterized protein (UPF0248 family)
MASPKEVLTKLKWGPGSDIRDAEIHFLHRGAPNDTKVIKGADIVELERSFFVTTEGVIPYHRIRKVMCRGKTLYESECPTLESNPESDPGNKKEIK